MCQVVNIKSGVRAPEDCLCYRAVMRAYGGMHDEPHSIAFDAALRVYRFHHPEDSKSDAHLTVERWLADGRLH